MSDLFEALADAAARGVDVTVITNHHPPAPLKLKWHQTITNMDARVRARAAGYELFVQDCDGDFSHWSVKRNGEVIATGKSWEWEPYYHCDACCLAAEEAVFADARRRLATLRPPKSAKPLSATMAAALALASEHGGKLERRTYGSWTYPGAPRRWENEGVPDWFVTNATVEALVKRGRMKFTEHKGVRGQRRPIVVEVVN